MMYLFQTHIAMGALGLCGKHNEEEGIRHHADSRAQGFGV